MKCYGIELRRVCQAVWQGANGQVWCKATVVIGYMFCEIPPEVATRLFIHWGNHSDIEKRKQMPAEVQYDHGRRCIVFRCLSRAKKVGLLESRGPAGAEREYRLTPKGLALLEGE
ncbi:MAG: hypothetical protein ACYSWU_13130 [Planctomycetota bacterium]|jgi:hypothetical protein